MTPVKAIIYPDFSHSFSRIQLDFFNYKFILSLGKTFVFILVFATLAYSQTDQNLTYASYHGGISEESGRLMDVWPDGSSIVAGVTESFNMPTTDDAFESVYQGNGDIFIARFDPEGSLVYGTFLGGSSWEFPVDIKFKADGGYIVVGLTSSENYPTTENSHQEEFYGEMAFISSFDAEDNLLWSTYAGGEGFMQIYSLDLDDDDNLYIVGGTTIPEMGTPGVHQETFPDMGNSSAYISKFNSSGEQSWFSYFYGPDSESNVSLTSMVLSSGGGEIYVSGESPGMEGITLNAHQEVYGGGFSDGIIASFNAENATLNWSTFYGGDGIDAFLNSAVAEDGTLFLSGESTSNQNISTPGVHQENYAGSGDHFVVAFQPDGTRLWGSFFGGPLMESGVLGLSLTSTDVLLTGRTQSLDNIVFGSPLETESNAEAPFTHTTYIARFNQNTGALSWATYFLGFCQGGLSDIGIVNDSRFIGIGALNSTCSEILTDDAYQNFPGGGSDMGFFIFDDMTVSTDEIKYAPLSVYPNPTSDFVQIALPEGVDNQMQIQVFDLQGRIVMEQAQFSNGGMLNVSSLPQAVYVLIGKTKDAAFRQKLVVTR